MQPFDSGQALTALLMATHSFQNNVAAQAFLGFYRTPHERAVRSCLVKPVVLVKDASRVDDDGLAGHRLGAAHGDHHVGAVVLVSGLSQDPVSYTHLTLPTILLV